MNTYTYYTIINGACRLRELINAFIKTSLNEKHLQICLSLC